MLDETMPSAAWLARRPAIAVERAELKLMSMARLKLRYASMPGFDPAIHPHELRHSGMRPLGRRPGIQHHALFWIPGSRQAARPGMTFETDRDPCLMI